MGIYCLLKYRDTSGEVYGTTGGFGGSVFVTYLLSRKKTIAINFHLLFHRVFETTHIENYSVRAEVRVHSIFAIK